MGLIGICGAYQFALGLYFIALRPPLLPEDLRFLDIRAAALKVVLPRLVPWLHLVFTVVGGQMAAVGALALGVALRLARDVSGGRQLVLLGAAGVFSVGTTSAVNFVLESNFRWLLVIPAGTWTAGLALALLSRGGGGGAESVCVKPTEGDHLG